MSIQWHEFNNGEARGRIGLERTPVGVNILAEDPTHPAGARCLAAVDLFHMLPENTEPGEPPYVQLICYNRNDQADPIAHVRFQEDQTRIVGP